MLTNIEPGGQAQAGPPWEAGGSVGSGNWWEEDWVGEELVGGVEGVARKEGWEDEQLEKAPGKGKCTKRRLTTFGKRGARAASRAAGTRFNSGEALLEPKTWSLSLEEALVILVRADVARRLRRHRGICPFQ